MLRKMESRGFGFNVVFYNNVMFVFCRMKRLDLVFIVFLEMLEKDIKFNDYIYFILIDGCFKNYDFYNVWEIIV